MSARRLLRPPFSRETGYCWVLSVGDRGDDVGDPRRSALALFEDGRELGPPHSSHSEIRALGAGRYSHWGHHLYFAASDNSDPNTNGREYSIEISMDRYFERYGRYAAAIVDFYVQHLGGASDVFRGRTVLEIGPGRDLGTGLLMAALGAKVVCIEKHHRGWEDGWHRPYVERILATAGSLPWKISEEPLIRSLQAGSFDPRSVTVLDTTLEQLPDSHAATADLFVSHSVFEHFENPERALRKLRAACRSDAAGAHRIDFRDHRDNQKPLEFLLLGDPKFEEVTGPYKYTHGNRVRLPEYLQLMKSAGFDVQFIEETVIDEAYLRAFIPRLRSSSSRFAMTPEGDLRALSGVFLMRPALTNGVSRSRT